jgi:hypothetical protein
MSKNPTISSIMNDDVRRANAQKAINKTIRNYVLGRIAVTAALAIGMKILAKKFDAMDLED